jgi:uncharacterized protein YdeI (YjbR/CyaY-like superfamily)
MSAPTSPPPDAFRTWREAHADSASELLVGFPKVVTGVPCMRRSGSVDDALSFGWVDGVRSRIDKHTYPTRFTPRNPSSIWSAVNIAKVNHLQAQAA